MANIDNGPVLVLGGTGFIGGYVARALAADGRKVTAYARRGPSPELQAVMRGESERITIANGSIGNLPDLLANVAAIKPSAIVHVAANVDVPALLRDPYLAFTDNVTGTINVFEAARLLGVRNVIFFSSIGVLPPRRYEPIDVNHPVIVARNGPGTGSYGAAKASGELFAYAYNQAYDLNIRIIRPSAVYGFGMPWHSANNIKELVEPAVRGEPAELASGGTLPRDYTHVQDVADLTVALLDAGDDTDKVFYAATGEELADANDVAKIIMNLIPGANISVSDVSTPLDDMEASFRGILSITNAREQLGWTPKFTPLREGIAEYISRYREFLAEG
ncbi:MAG TPA: NAD(P)-dependent oxidoreductase [Streptosporangiaceae bacterium]|nr:NAD(P)-dependent oxidoreductase [Streptosporangiaceae bacterium]